MAYLIKEADVQKDKHIMVDILRQNRQRDDFDYDARYDWIYLNNPLGRAKAWIIWNEKNDEAAGFTGVFPRALYVNGQRYVGWNCGDFSIHKKYRTLGIALKLRKAAKDGVDSGEVPFLYAHPNERMEVIHLKAGHRKIARMQRYALLLRTDRMISRFIPSGALSKLVSAPLNLMLSSQYRFVGTDGWSAHLRDRIDTGREHEEIFKAMIGRFPVIGARDSEYLNWKFGTNPNHRFMQMDIYKYNELAAVLFYHVRKNTVNLVDVLIKDVDHDAAAIFACFIKTIIEKYREAASVSFILQEYNALIPVLRSLGFTFRDDATSAVISYAGAELAEEMFNGTKWYMTVGDRDA